MPKPLQGAPEYFDPKFSGVTALDKAMMSPDDLVLLFTERVMKDIRGCKCGADLVKVLKQEWKYPDPVCTTRKKKYI